MKSFRAPRVRANANCESEYGCGVIPGVLCQKSAAMQQETKYAEEGKIDKHHLGAAIGRLSPHGREERSLEGDESWRVSCARPHLLESRRTRARLTHRRMSRDEKDE